jgi:outer membrane protein, heavy metal efflux system
MRPRSPWLACLKLAAVALPVLSVWPCLAAQAAPPADFAQAQHAAWQRSVAQRTLPERRAELQARRNAAAAWLADAPSVGLAHTTDRFGRKAGAREDELELALPLAWPARRGAAVALADGEGRSADAQVAAAQLAVAGELREAVWALRLAGSEARAASSAVADTQALADDVQRRERAGDLARTDLNQALAAVQQARAAQAEAQARLVRAQRHYEALTGLTQPPAEPERLPAPLPVIDTHPQWQALQAAADAAQARLNLATRDSRDAPELALAVVRERSAAGEPGSTHTRIGVRVPLGTAARNHPRITAAAAERATALAEAAVQRERLQAAIDSAAAEHRQAEQVLGFSAERERLATDTQVLLAKAFSLGQVDLPTRLRAEQERTAAAWAHTRAQLELGRATSNLLQALGVLP